MAFYVSSIVVDLDLAALLKLAADMMEEWTIQETFDSLEVLPIEYNWANGTITGDILWIVSDAEGGNTHV